MSAVGQLAERIAPTVDDQGSTVVAAAYLPDVGYADVLAVTAFYVGALGRGDSHCIGIVAQTMG